MLTLTRIQIEKLTKAEGRRRYEYSVKKIVDWEVAWGLYDDGWIMGADDNENPIFPLWPARQLAELCAIGDWKNCLTKEIDLDYLMDDLLPNLIDDEINLGIFGVLDRTDTPVVKPADFLRDLTAECDRY
ncbi:DUF2750 domain-containing protein [Burkholderia ambifaria]|uniref:DUF2750 domain-containing protein n=1 Tax=Burkholderia ambifaria TaxID=152480 RepID=UPI00158AEB4A|nr:DUF2750 domain-containing protein [Burkholderia ambifaria]